jgi:hypothetical protein
MVHVHTSADFSEHCALLPDSMDHLLPDTENKLIPRTLVSADAVPSEPTTKPNINSCCKEILKNRTANKSSFNASMVHNESD